MIHGEVLEAKEPGGHGDNFWIPDPRNARLKSLGLGDEGKVGRINLKTGQRWRKPGTILTSSMM